MKHIIAIIRPGKDRETKKEISKIGGFGSSSVRVYGRGRQRGLKYRSPGDSNAQAPAITVRYLPKKMLSLVVPEQETKATLEAIIRANKTGEYGDGKIFVMDMAKVYRIRTGQKDEEAIR